MMPGQLGPMSLLPVCSFRRRLILTMSCCGMPVMADRAGWKEKYEKLKLFSNHDKSLFQQRQLGKEVGEGLDGCKSLFC